MKFPYRTFPVIGEPGVVRHAPYLDLSLSNPAALDPVTWVTIVALADTGADFVMVPHYFADELQIELGPPSTITDFGNQAHQIRFGVTH